MGGYEHTTGWIELLGRVTSSSQWAFCCTLGRVGNGHGRLGSHVEPSASGCSSSLTTVTDDAFFRP